MTDKNDITPISNGFHRLGYHHKLTQARSCDGIYGIVFKRGISSSFFNS